MNAGLAVLSSFTYTYDRVGNRTSVAEADGGRTSWSYDRTYQLTREHRTDALSWDGLTIDQWDMLTVDDWDKMEVTGAGGPLNLTYTYDPVGNRLVQNDSGRRTTCLYDAANELLTAKAPGGTTTYTYDQTGNRRTKEDPTDGVSTYSWDPQDRLLEVEQPDNSRYTFAYNADGQRIRRATPEEVRKFVYDLRKPLLETTAAGATTLTYDYTNRGWPR